MEMAKWKLLKKLRNVIRFGRDIYRSHFTSMIIASYYMKYILVDNTHLQIVET